MTMPQMRPAPALSNPATGSANPAASLQSLWNYVAPAAAHLMQAPTNNPGKAPALDVGYHMGIHTAVYNYFTVPRPGGAPAGADFYELLDGWFGEVARDTLLGLPEDDSERLVQYLVPCFQRYQSGAGAVSRLLNYTNRQYVKRAIDEDRGWLRLADVIDDVAEAVRNKESHAKLAGRLRARRDGELMRWGWNGNASDTESITKAEAAAEAGAPPDRVVPLAALAQRRFRIEVLEPLLMVPKAKKKGKGKAKAKSARGVNSEGNGGNGGTGSGGGPGASSSAGGSGGAGGSGSGNGGVGASGSGAANGGMQEKAGPKGRLARSVKELLEGNGVDQDERIRVARGACDMLRACGVPPEHALYRKLVKYNAGVQVAET